MTILAKLSVFSNFCRFRCLLACPVNNSLQQRYLPPSNIYFPLIFSFMTNCAMWYDTFHVSLNVSSNWLFWFWPDVKVLVHFSLLEVLPRWEYALPVKSTTSSYITIIWGYKLKKEIQKIPLMQIKFCRAYFILSFVALVESILL